MGEEFGQATGIITSHPRAGEKRGRIHLYLFLAAAPAAATKAGSQVALFNAIMPFVLMFVIFYFLLIRPQQKQEKDRRAMLGALHKGDDVVTLGGLKGTIVEFEEKGSDNYVIVRAADKVELRFLRSAVNRVIKKD
jgi:preprotein translocase subunit YajC